MTITAMLGGTRLPIGQVCARLTRSKILLCQPQSYNLQTICSSKIISLATLHQGVSNGLLLQRTPFHLYSSCTTHSNLPSLNRIRPINFLSPSVNKISNSRSPGTPISRLLWTCTNQSNFVQTQRTNITGSTHRSTLTPRRYFWQPIFRELSKHLSKRVIGVGITAIARVLPALAGPIAAFVVSRVLPALGIVLVIVWLGYVFGLIPAKYLRPGGIGLLVISLVCYLTAKGITMLHDQWEDSVFTQINQFFGTEVARGSKEIVLRNWEGLAKPLHLKPRRVSWHFGNYLTESSKQDRMIYIKYEWDIDVPSENKLHPFERVIGKAHSIVAFSSSGWQIRRITFQNEKPCKKIQLFPELKSQKKNNTEK